MIEWIVAEVHLFKEGSAYKSSRNICTTSNCIHKPKCFMPVRSRAAASHHQSLSLAAEAEPSPSKSQLKKQVKILKRQLEAAERALQDVTPPAERKRAREEVSPAMRSEKRTRATGMFEQGVIISPST